MGCCHPPPLLHAALLALTLILGACSAAPTTAPSRPATDVAHRAPAARYIATIAVDSYADRQQLTGAVTDADEVATAFTTRLSFSTTDDLHLWDGAATARGIRRFVGPNGPLNGLNEDGLLVLYVALHATTSETKDGPSGQIWAQDVGTGSEPIPVGELLRALDALKVAHVILLFDTCYGGLALEAADLKPLSYAALRPRVEDHGAAALRPSARHSRKVLTAAGLAQTADDGDLTRRGRFAAGLLQGLDGAADLYPDGDLLFVELAVYVQDKVTRDSHGAQEPEYGGFRTDERGAPSLGPLALHAAGQGSSPAGLIHAAKAQLDAGDAWQARLTLGRYLAADRRRAIADRRDAEEAERLAAEGDAEAAIERLDRLAERQAAIYGSQHPAVAVTRQRQAAIGTTAGLPAHRVAALEAQAAEATRRAAPPTASGSGRARALSAVGGLATTLGAEEAAKVAAEEAGQQAGVDAETEALLRENAAVSERTRTTADALTNPGEALPATSYRPAMLAIAPGEFAMGSPKGEAGRDDERAHRVKLTRGFLMAETEVTQAQYAALMGSNPARFQGVEGDGTRPVEQVSWLDAVKYCNALSVEEGLPPAYAIVGDGVTGDDGAGGYRLPTEAEWEYAARAGTATATYAGDLEIVGQHNAPVLNNIAWYGGNSGSTHPRAEDSSAWSEKQYPHEKASTQPVKGKRPNAWGLYDMLGNVWEWTWDRFGTYRPAADGAPLVDPAGPPRGGWRVMRGGSFFYDARRVRAASRDRRDPGYQDWDLGFRPVRFAAPPRDLGDGL